MAGKLPRWPEQRQSTVATVAYDNDRMASWTCWRRLQALEITAEMSSRAMIACEVSIGGFWELRRVWNRDATQSLVAYGDCGVGLGSELRVQLAAGSDTTCRTQREGIGNFGFLLWERTGGRAREFAGIGSAKQEGDLAARFRGEDGGFNARRHKLKGRNVPMSTRVDSYKLGVISS